MLTVSIKDYTKSILTALQQHQAKGGNLYQGIEGSKRLAREYGYGLNDYPQQARDDEARSSYSTLYVKGFNLKPVIDAKEWISEIRSQFLIPEEILKTICHESEWKRLGFKHFSFLNEIYQNAYRKLYIIQHQSNNQKIIFQDQGNGYCNYVMSISEYIIGGNTNSMNYQAV